MVELKDALATELVKPRGGHRFVVIVQRAPDRTRAFGYRAAEDRILACPRGAKVQKDVASKNST